MPLTSRASMVLSYPSFAIHSTVFSSMQIVMAVEQTPPSHWTTFKGTSRWLSVVTLTALAALTFGLIPLLLFKLIQEWRFALTYRYWKPDLDATT